MAGHAGPLWLRADGEDAFPVGSSGLPLGLVEDAEYEASSVAIEANDILLFYTDGIVEAFGIGGRQYGHRRLADQLIRHGRLEPDELLAEVEARGPRELLKNGPGAYLAK